MPSPPKVVRLDEVRRAALARASPVDDEGHPRTPGAPPKAPESDGEELVQGFRERKRWAARALLERYGPHVERVLTHILGGHADLDDLAQEVFVRALARVGDLREPQALKDWLAGFAGDVAREAIRRKRRRWWVSIAGGPSTGLIDSSVGATGVFTVDATSIYFMANAAVMKLPKTGGAPVLVAPLNIPAVIGTCMASDDTYVYWVDGVALMQYKK
jgi:hypothetical protein